MRAGDTAARLGGDEFILLLEELKSVEEAEQVAQRLHDILKAPFIVGRREVLITSSIGIAISARHRSTGRTLAQRRRRHVRREA